MTSLFLIRESGRRRWKGFQAFAFLLMLGIPVARASADQPNVVIMLSDNLGYGELGCYGGGSIRGAETPRLDAFAEEGTRFANFNVEVECTPSRSALMTGRLPYRSGTGRAASAGLPSGLAPWEYTMGEMFKDAGYDTAIYGKWHLGSIAGRFPTDQGFDEWYGIPFSTNLVTYFDQPGFELAGIDRPSILEGTSTEGVRAVEFYTPERRRTIDETITNKSVEYIRRHADSDRPFFLFVPFTQIHHPYLPHADFEGKSGSGPVGDMVMEHDFRVGQILDAIDQAGLGSETLVIYASDNGPDSAHYPQISNSGPFRGYLGSAYEGSIRTPLIMRWPEKIPASRETNEIVAILDFLPTLAGWIGKTLPRDRAYDGLDQGDFFLGKTEASNRDHVIIFSGETLLAVKWNQYKVFLTGDDPNPRDRMIDTLWAPRIFNIQDDPREEYDRVIDSLWTLKPALTHLLQFVVSVRRYGVIPLGGEERVKSDVDVPFLNARDIDAIVLREFRRRLSGGKAQ